MRLRLILSAIALTLVSILSVVLIAHQRNATAVRAYMFRGGAIGLEPLVKDLENYYQDHHTWEGAQTLLSKVRPPGHGPDSQQGRAILLDANGDEVGGNAHFPPGALEQAIQLKVRNETIGYLMPPNPPMRFTPADETLLLQRLDGAAWSAALIASALALLLALVFANRLLRPIRALTSAAQRMATGDLSQRVPVHGNDELALLGNTFNQMAAALQQAEIRRKALTADIAHELRTPLAVQRAHLEALQDGIYPLTTQNLRPIAESNVLLTRLVEDLRTLALADAGQLKLTRVPTDIAALLGRLLEQHAPAAGARSIKLVLAPKENLPSIPADPGRLGQILNNLLTNALRHTPQGGQVHISIQQSGPQIVIRVQDSGPGIPPEDLPHIFERFYRADKSRARTEGGTGLGLTIARQLARAHGGDLRAENAPEGGAIFTLSLPIHPPKSSGNQKS